MVFILSSNGKDTGHTDRNATGEYLPMKVCEKLKTVAPLWYENMLESDSFYEATINTSELRKYKKLNMSDACCRIVGESHKFNGKYFVIGGKKYCDVCRIFSIDFVSSFSWGSLEELNREIYKFVEHFNKEHR